MDISSLIPMLMNGNGLNGMGDKEKLIMNMLQGKNMDINDLMKDMKKPEGKGGLDMAQMLSMFKKNASKPDNSFSIVKILAPSDILGKIFKYYSN